MLRAAFCEGLDPALQDLVSAVAGTDETGRLFRFIYVRFTWRHDRWAFDVRIDVYRQKCNQCLGWVMLLGVIGTFSICCGG